MPRALFQPYPYPKRVDLISYISKTPEISPQYIKTSLLHLRAAKNNLAHAFGLGGLSKNEALGWARLTELGSPNSPVGLSRLGY